jgi:hypothetical protein
LSAKAQSDNAKAKGGQNATNVRKQPKSSQ